MIVLHPSEKMDKYSYILLKVLIFSVACNHLTEFLLSRRKICLCIIVFSGQWRLPGDGHRKLALAHWSNHGGNSRSYRAWKNLIPTHSSCAQWRDTEEVHTGKSVSNNAGVLQHFCNKVHLCIIVSTMYRTYNFWGVFF